MATAIVPSADSTAAPSTTETRAGSKLARQRWKAALAETQRRRVEALRRQQSADAARATEKQRLSARIEGELQLALDELGFAALLAHFGASSYKKLLVLYHPDRTPTGAPFEEVVRREVIFKYVQQRRDRCGGGAGGRGNQAARGSQRDAADAARRWRRQQEQEQERQRQRAAQHPAGAVLRVVAPAVWSGTGDPPEAGPLGYYAVDAAGPTWNGKPCYRKMPKPVPEWAPWAEAANAKHQLEADQIFWAGTFWQLGHREAGRVTYMLAVDSATPPAGREWDVVDSRAPEPWIHWTE
jgi:hypothetical protein